MSLHDIMVGPHEFLHEQLEKLGLGLEPELDLDVQDLDLDVLDLCDLDLLDLGDLDLEMEGILQENVVGICLYNMNKIGWDMFFDELDYQNLCVYLLILWQSKINVEKYLIIINFIEDFGFIWKLAI